ncbi:MAG: GNAT family N-acetyltransferase [Syntrophorhabdaceae bacterium]|nr:GNAT family N-acetyltransferase [Syntrophorhabdaceae bacterium]
MGDLTRVFNPRTIAVIDGDGKDGLIGKRIIENIRLKSRIKVFPVRMEGVGESGLESFKDLSSIKDHIDLAVLLASSGRLPDVLEECGRAGVDGVLIPVWGSSFSEEDRTEIERVILEKKGKYGIRIIGPCSAGLIRPNTGLDISLFSKSPEKGKVAFVSQGSAVASGIVDWAVNAHIGFSMFISLGWMVDVDFGDVIDFLGDDHYTRSIMLYLETIGKAKKFMSATRGFARSKPIVIIKPKSTKREGEEGEIRIVDEEKVYDTAFMRVGAIRVKAFADLFNCSEVLDSRYLPKGIRLAIITNADGFGKMAADVIFESGFNLAEFTEKSKMSLKSFLPSGANIENPLNIYEDADGERYTNCVKTCLSDGNVDGVLVIYAPQPIVKTFGLAEALVEVASKSPKPIVTAWIGGEEVEKERMIFRKNNIPTYNTPEEAAKTYFYMFRYHRNLTLLYETPSEPPILEAPSINHLRVMLKRAIKYGLKRLPFDTTREFLRAYGIPVVYPYKVKEMEGALRVSRRIGFPVLLKSPSTHLSEGSIDSDTVIVEKEDVLKEKYHAFENRERLNIKGQGNDPAVFVQKHISKIEQEMFLRSERHRDFGAVIYLGMREGNSVKILSTSLPPLNQTLARRMLEEGEMEGVLRRMMLPQTLIKRFESVLICFSNLIVDFPEALSIHIDPLVICGEEIWATGGEIEIDLVKVDGYTNYPHLVIAPYPTRYVSQWKMLDGQEVLIRPIRPEDEPLEREMLSTLSERSMRTRFFSIIKEITHEMLVRFCNIDYEREMALVAEIREGERKRIIGISRLILDSDLKRGEFAVLVHDDFHRRGLGYKLVDLLIGFAQEKGLEEIYGTVLKENDNMLNLAKKLGFTLGNYEDGLVKVNLPIG